MVATGTPNDIKQEFKKVEEDYVRGREVVAKLEKDARDLERLVKASREQVETIATFVWREVKPEVRAEGRRSTRVQFWMNCFFFVLGVVATLVVPSLLDLVAW